jgi:acyl-CoA dehydrogenase
MRGILEDSINRILADRVNPGLLQEAESGTWPQSLWKLLEESGFTLALVPEDKGGSGASWADVHPLVFAAGKYALPLPLPETMLAAWALGISGIDVPEGSITIADPLASAPLRASRAEGAWRLHGELAHVPWGANARHLAAQVSVDGQPSIALLAPSGLPVERDRNVAREPRDHLLLEGVAALALAPLPAWLGPAPLRLYGAMLRAAQSAGAIDRLVEQAVQYAGERVQFGKPIGRFQAIQQQIAVLGCESAASGAAAAFAFEQAGTAGAELAIATAKIRAGEAAGKASSIAHAVHGAIGFTYEHTLHFASRRLWSWRSEFGNHAWWSRRLGNAVCAGGADRLWPTITAGTLGILDDT